MNKEDCISAIRQHLPTIQKDFGVTGLTLFGSVARGDEKPESDVDLLVEMPPKIFVLSALHRYLENLLHTSVDLIHRHSQMNPRFLNEVARDGITILWLSKKTCTPDSSFNRVFLSSNFPDIPWIDIIGMRNRIVHGYFELDAEIVLDAIKNDIPPLQDVIIKAIEILKSDICHIQ